MASDKYADIISKVKDILSTCSSIGVVNIDDLNSALEDITSLQEEAFSGKVNATHASKIAIKEMHDYVSSMKRFCGVYKYNRKDYYDKAKDYFTAHAGMLDHQKSVFEKFYEYGTQ